MKLIVLKYPRGHEKEAEKKLGEIALQVQALIGVYLLPKNQDSIASGIGYISVPDDFAVEIHDLGELCAATDRAVSPLEIAGRDLVKTSDNPSIGPPLPPPPPPPPGA